MTTPRPTLLARITATFASLVFALALGELIATCALDGAYPTLNLYEADSNYGVVLTREASTRVVSPNGTLTEIETNALGFRGAAWPGAADGEGPGQPSGPSGEGVVAKRVLVVGDSQVMGWGVPVEALFTNALPGYEVIAAGVPTWGPFEYVRAMNELVPRYRPERVVFLVNAANDWDEAPYANVHRTSARDGWAVMVAGLEEATDFPGRRWFLGRSHLILAVRMLLNPPKRGLHESLAMRFVNELPKYTEGTTPHHTRLGRHLAAARGVCQRFGCELVPVYLPMDIQVHPTEWAKYGAKARDMRPALGLTRALRADAPELVDVSAALVAASPGAFLPDDYHLSPAGHAAVAAVLRRRLAAPVVIHVRSAAQESTR